MNKILGFALLGLVGFAAFAVFLSPVHMAPKFGASQSLIDLNRPVTFGITFYLFAALSLFTGFYLAKEKSRFTLVPIIIYSLIFLGFWTFRSPLPLTTEAPTNMGLLKDILGTGQLNLSLGYLQYPYIFLFASALNSVTGASLLNTVVTMEVIRLVVFATLFYLVPINLGYSRVVGAMSAFLATQCDVMLTRMPAFHAEVFGLVFFLFGMLVVVRRGWSKSSYTAFMLIALAASMSYALSAAMLFAAVGGLAIWERTNRNEHRKISFHMLITLSIVFAGWNLLAATQIPNALSTFQYEITQLFNFGHYYFLSTNITTNTLTGPVWISYSTLVSLGVLFGIPLLFVARDFVTKSAGRADFLVVSLLFAILPLFVLQGGAEAERILYYVAPFSAPILVGKLVWGRHRVGWVHILIFVIITLSFPNFLAYNVQANSNANYPQGLVAGQYLVSFAPENTLPLYLGSGVIGVPGSFTNSHQTVTPDFALVMSENLQPTISSSLDDFKSQTGSLLAISPSFYLSIDFVYGVNESKSVSSFINSVSEGENMVYDNGYTQLYLS